MTILVNDINLFYTEEGTGTPLIFLHGNGEDYSIFKNSISFFSKKYRVIAIDSRGHGQSDIGNRKLSIPIMAEDIIEFIKKLELKDVIMIGFSDGGNIVLEVASAIPNTTKKIVIVGANTKYDGLKLWVQIGIRVSYFIFSLLSFIPSYSLKQKQYSIMLHQPEISYQKISSISAETLIIVGENDMIKQLHTEYIQQSIKNSKLLIIPNCNHFPFKNKNFEINNIIVNYL